MSMYQRLSQLVDPRTLQSRPGQLQNFSMRGRHTFLDNDLHDLFFDANRHDHAVEAEKRRLQARIDGLFKQSVELSVENQSAGEKLRVCALLAQTVTQERDEVVKLKEFLHKQFTTLSNSYNALFREQVQLKEANKALVADNYKLAQERNAANEQLCQEKEQSKKASEQQQARFDSLASRYVIASKKIKDLEEEKETLAQQRNEAFVRERELHEKLTTAKQQAAKRLTECNRSRYDQAWTLHGEIGIFKQKTAELTADNKRLADQLSVQSEATNVACRGAADWYNKSSSQATRINGLEHELKDTLELNKSLEETNNQLVDKYNALGRTHECVVRRLNDDLKAERQENTRLTDQCNSLVQNQMNNNCELIELQKKYWALENSQAHALQTGITNAVSAAVAEERVKHDATKEALKLAKTRLEHLDHKQKYVRQTPIERLFKSVGHMKGELLLVHKGPTGGLSVWSTRSDDASKVISTRDKCEIFKELAATYGHY